MIDLPRDRTATRRASSAKWPPTSSCHGSTGCSRTPSGGGLGVFLGFREKYIPFSYLDRSGPLDICNGPPRPANNHRCPRPCRNCSLDFHVTKFASHRVREWIAGIGLDLLKYGTG
jgi:hypothetical protein